MRERNGLRQQATISVLRKLVENGALRAFDRLGARFGLWFFEVIVLLNQRFKRGS
jgi:hypothetical protein